MPISPLPEGTVRRLGSTLVITSPVLLLKELLDNAIDSGATSVEVLVSPNTVDRIEVRDNGHGISPDDFDSLGRPGHTSKLDSFDQLGTLGGRSLGFRGAALASANALAGVSLTTRVATEPVATVVSLAHGGGVGSLRPASASVGTTVSVTSLFSRVPVRLQVAIKEATKNLAKLKELLRSYVLARPSLRLRFVVLKTPSLSWSYAPAANADVREAAMQLFGTELASQCVFKTSLTNMGRDESSGVQSGTEFPLDQETGLVFEALLPKPGADARKIAKGAYLSVDSRPVSPLRGTGKKLVSAFKRRLEDQLAWAGSGDVPRDPFIRLNIRCPPGSYDVNVEPSKEDVLFTEEQKILDEFESFLSSIYPVSAGPDPPQRPLRTAETTDVEANQVVQPEAPDCPLASQDTVPSWRVDMSSGLDGPSDDDVDFNDSFPPARQQRTHGGVLSTPGSDVDEDDNGQQSREQLNPWSLAKLTASHRRAEPTLSVPVHQTHRGTQFPRPQPTAISALDRDSLVSHERRSTRGLSPDNWRQDRTENPASLGKSLQEVFRRPLHGAAVSRTGSSNWRHQRNGRRGLQSPPTSSPHEGDFDRPVTRVPFHPPRTRGSRRLVQSRISFDRRTRGRRHDNSVYPELDEQLFAPPSPNRRTEVSTVSRRAAATASDMTANRVDDETRAGPTFTEASPHRQVVSHDTSEAGGTPMGDRQEAGSSEATPQPSTVADDPRRQLIKQQRFARENPQKKLKPLKTEQLPLEMIPCGLQTCTLLLTMEADAGRLAQLLTGRCRFDTWLADGRLRSAFKDGIDPEKMATVVESLLGRISHGSGGITQAGQPCFGG